MKKTIAFCAIIFAAAAVVGAQDANQSDRYQGVSNPPADDQIVTSQNAPAKPSAAKRAGPVAAQDQQQQQEQPPAESTAPDTSSAPAGSDSTAGTDAGIVQVAPEPASTNDKEPALNSRRSTPDPDGDIVHPAEPGPGELGEGTTIRVKLLNRLSTATTEKGEKFRTKVATDVVRDGEVLIPAGSEIDGQVAEVSSGHFGSSGTLRLKPETLIFTDGRRFQLHANTSDTHGSKTNVGSEGEIKPDSRVKRNSIEYGGAVGAGVTTGAIMGGPAGALTGGLIGAGLVTAHVLISHPQAVLEPDTVLEFTLSETLSLSPESESEK